MDEAQMIPDAEFRAAGFTGEARKYPLSEKGVAWLARFNGLTMHQLPRAWRYAPNAYMQDHINRLGEQSYHPSELPERLKIAIRDARMGSEHSHLNALLDTTEL